MARLGCPCGNIIWNGSDVTDNTYSFVPFNILEEMPEYHFFSLELDFPERVIEIWKCDMCDNMMAIDEPDGANSRVTRWFRRISVDDITDESLDAEAVVPGYIYNNLFFDRVTVVFERDEKYIGRFEYRDGVPIIPYDAMKEEVFSHKNGRYTDWWYAKMDKTHLIFYRKPEMIVPVKAWRIFIPTWENFDD